LVLTKRHSDIPRTITIKPLLDTSCTWCGICLHKRISPSPSVIAPDLVWRLWSWLKDHLVPICSLGKASNGHKETTLEVWSNASSSSSRTSGAQICTNLEYISTAEQQEFQFLWLLMNHRLKTSRGILRGCCPWLSDGWINSTFANFCFCWKNRQGKEIILISIEKFFKVNVTYKIILVDSRAKN
jgi:hypothetical protein